MLIKDKRLKIRAMGPFGSDVATFTFLLLPFYSFARTVISNLKFEISVSVRDVMQVSNYQFLIAKQPEVAR